MSTHPAVNLPIILVPAIVARHMGITSCNSASNTLHFLLSASFSKFSNRFPGLCVQALVLFPTAPTHILLSNSGEGGYDAPVEILRGANRNDGICICEGREDADPVSIKKISRLQDAAIKKRTHWSSRIGRGQPWWWGTWGNTRFCTRKFWG